eukprot:CAMPEP_0171529308 /NCGR_PEP_ID=MMETSP0959-20130129/12283_1 /TAXON_ID=87120 /ORGANISM="Aurantiochytrium limacinum, Strain ATCCMYA-1381" /LENGTH=268 /DNA_ID=CAMNT_0012071641 /DNA_START=63 /DNA_END=869 /DNA_ORIENTATION=+
MARALASLEREVLIPRVLSGRRSGTREDLKSWDSLVQAFGLESWLQAHASSGGAAVLTKLLSYPLTLAKYAKTAEGKNAVNVSIVGARAESTLPALYWECMASMAEFGPGTSTVDHWNLHFVGPHANASGPRIHEQLRTASEDQTNVNNDDSLNCRRVSFSVEQKRLQDSSRVMDADFFAFFNSGIGHAKESQHWQDALVGLKGSNCYALFTSFNEQDLSRDLKALEALGVEIVLSEPENSLRSLSPDFSPEGERVFANAAVTLAKFI